MGWYEYSPKLDGWRCVVHVPGGVLQSRTGSDLTGRLPGVLASAAALGRVVLANARNDRELRILCWAAHQGGFGPWGQASRAVTHLTEVELARFTEEYNELAQRYYLRRSAPTPGTRELAMRFYAFPTESELALPTTGRLTAVITESRAGAVTARRGPGGRLRRHDRDVGARATSHVHRRDEARCAGDEDPGRAAVWRCNAQPPARDIVRCDRRSVVPGTIGAGTSKSKLPLSPLALFWTIAGVVLWRRQHDGGDPAAPTTGGR
ncbi:hypothetical protein [Amycolatopsis sp. NPDC051372]|uniref:hypothetical protein n=1 Tax=Amycolatopsis sp. NPDC051372 TaxID=3155669 RepID=UPI0034203B1D